MKNVIKLSLAAALALLNSCSKSGGSTQTPTDPVKHKLLASETTGASTINYTYDTHQKLTSKSIGASQTTYQYYDDGTLYLVTTTNGQFRDTYETTYAFNKLASVAHKRYQNDLIKTTDTYTLTYSDAGNLIQLKDDGDGGLIVTKYYYDANNVINKTDTNDGNIVNTYTFDGKKSRYTNMAATLKNIVSGGLDYLLPNNIASLISYSGQSLKTTTYTYTYVYDADGYPTSRTQTVNFGSGTPQTSTTTYTYTNM